jgi:membrane protein YqaA with SNARE-associated domain
MQQALCTFKPFSRFSHHNETESNQSNIYERLQLLLIPMNGFSVIHGVIPVLAKLLALQKSLL